MMGSAHSFFAGVPNWAGFAILIGVWVIFRSLLLRWRRNAMGRMMGRVMPPSPLPPTPLPPAPLPPGHVTYGQNRCPRCSAMAPGVAMFCPHCGLSFASLPPPVPQAQWTGKRRDQRWVMVIVAILGLIGLVAYCYWRITPEKAPPPQPPEVTHRHYHYP